MYRFAEIMEAVATAIELFGVGVIVFSVIASSLSFATRLYHGHRKTAYDAYRANLGRGILLGLELLVAADIIATVTSPLTWESVSLLGMIIIIRTFLSFSIEAEIEGRLPWQRN